MRLTVAPAATEDLLVRFLAVFLVYAAARNFVAPRASFRRLAWVAFATGVALSVLGLAQYLSGARSRIYWGEDTGYAVFGPFVNKNHFAFQVNLFAGLAAGLFLCVARRPAWWNAPPGLALLGGLGLMAAAVAFSQSRGGMIAGVAAAVLAGAVAWSVRGRADARGRRAGLVLALGVLTVATVLVAWFGWRGAADRIATLWGGQADNRTADWRSVWPLVEQFPVFGVGGGGLVYAEPMVRTRPDLIYQFNTLDNEYLEALVEGGVPRFALTLALSVAAVWGAVAAFRRDPDRPNAPLALGCAFGLGAVAFQSVGDFGLHTSSVAVAAAVVAAYAQASAVRRQKSEPATNRGAYVAAGVLVLAGLLVALAEWRLYLVDRLRLAAGSVLRSDVPDRESAAIRHLEAATRVRPNDPAVWDDLARVHLFAAADRQEVALAALAGPLVFAAPPTSPPAGDPGRHITAALRAARTSRDTLPLGLEAHLTLGIFADRFARFEPAATHLGRAKRVAGFDPDVWYTAGNVAADRGDWPAAISDWQESLSRSPKWIAVVTRRAATHLSPEELRTRLLPDDPAVWFAATRFVFADSADPARVAWLKATANRWEAGPEPAALAGFVAWATTLEELGDGTGAVRVWRRAVERFPEETTPRDRLAARLEAEELYEEAVPVLEWLAARHPNNGGYSHRLEAARHALKLKADIDRP
jgi:O-antigen ligase/tetratricopeptide (TPR) repeat protein